MITEPKIEQRAEQPCVAIRTQVAMRELPAVIPSLMDEVTGWLAAHGVVPAGAPFIRYHVINMEDKLDLAIGFPVPTGVSGDDRVTLSAIPSGRYAVLLYTGDYSGLMDANRVLIEWAQANGVQWDRWDDPNGDAFAARLEHYLTDPAAEPDSSKWETEVAIKVK